ncbi:MAG: Prolyl aminopeptidase [Segetibacter sp.]|nr:Prolyl aminopeptidase [Segetibacter sp.]
MLLKIEPVKNEELTILLNISRKTFYDTFHEKNTDEDMELFLESTFNPDVLKFEMSEAFNYFFFAKMDNEIAGYLKLSTAKIPHLDELDVLEISRIYVLKEKLGSGVGKELMEFAISFAKQLAKKTICLGVWEHNQRAITFYKSFGFEKFDEHIFMVGNDAQTDWLMKKELSASPKGS